MTKLYRYDLRESRMLVDHGGRFFYGTVSFDPGYQTGSISFPNTPYGEIKGPFNMVTTDENNPAIELKNLPLKKFSGKAHLAGKRKRCLECDITAELKTRGMGDMKLIGYGSCYDENKAVYDISFQ